jgi:hypothetical protein
MQLLYSVNVKMYYFSCLFCLVILYLLVAERSVQTDDVERHACAVNKANHEHTDARLFF